jgi:hypothetical protein
MLNPGGLRCSRRRRVHGLGVFETLKEISRLSLDAIRNRIAEQKKGGVGGSRAPASSPRSQTRERRRESATADSASASVPPPRRRPRRPQPQALGTDPALMEPLQVEFAEEDTDKLKLRAVKMHGKLDIGQELEKLRAITSAKGKGPAAARTARSTSCSRSSAPGRDSDQEVSRRVALEVPEHLLRGLTDLRIHLGFDRDGPRGGPARRRARHPGTHPQAPAAAAAAGPRAQDEGVAAATSSLKRTVTVMTSRTGTPSTSGGM